MKEQDMQGARIAIVGGGITGLTTAYRLRESGAEVTLIEAGDRLGGLAAGFDLAGHRVEQAYHFLYRTDEHILGLVDELGLKDKLRYHKSSVSTYYDGKLWPMEGPLDLIRFTPLKFVDRIRAGLSVLWLQRTKDWKRFENVTALDWLRRHAGRRVCDVIWEPLLRGKFDKYYDRVTMSWLWGRILQRVDSRDPELGGEALGYFEGGFNTLIRALEEPVRAAGTEVLLKTPVGGITHDAETDEVVLDLPGGARRFDRVLLTVPSGVAAKMIATSEPRDPDYFARLRSIDYLDAVVHVFASRQKFTRFYWHNVNTPDAPFVVFLSLTNLVGAERFDGLNIYYIGAYVPPEHAYATTPDPDLKSLWYDQIHEMFPEFDRGEVVDDALFRLRNAQHIVDLGFAENKLLDHETPCPGVILCNFSQIYPMDRGTNYAVRDGNRMAEMLARDLADRPVRRPAAPSARGLAAAAAS
nr:NAD(P)/FAD-dependent oxidoreductase [Limimaricola pyoseonensis]